MSEILWFFGGMAALFAVAATVWLVLWFRAFKGNPSGWDRMENDLNDVDDEP